MPGITITTKSRARITSVAIITGRRGSRATAAVSTCAGPSQAAKVSALSTAISKLEWVFWNTSTLAPTHAVVSPTMLMICDSQVRRTARLRSAEVKSVKPMSATRLSGGTGSAHGGGDVEVAAHAGVVVARCLGLLGD